MSDTILKSFQFHIPVELSKSTNQDGEDEWRVQGIASTGDADLQGEIVDQNGLDISLLKAGRGLFNCDHQKGPENVLGQIEDAEFVQFNGSRALLVKGYLFKHQPRAQAFYNILKSLKKSSSARVHMSIEGKIIDRDDKNGAIIRKARIDKVALTLDPVNPYTYVDLAKSMASGDLTSVPEAQFVVEADELTKAIEAAVKKAMSVGASQLSAPADRSGAGALVKESLASKLSKISQKDKKTKRQLIKSILQRLAELYPAEVVLPLAKSLAAALKGTEGDKNV